MSNGKKLDDMPDLKLLENELKYEKQREKWFRVTVAVAIVAVCVIAVAAVGFFL